MKIKHLKAWLACAGVSVVVIAAAAAIVASAAFGAGRTSPRMFRPAFERISGTVLLSGANYVAVAGGAPGQVRLINAATGRSFTTVQPGCYPDAVGGIWLALTCTAGHRETDSLYDIPHRRSVAFTPSPTCTGGPCASIAAIGTRWVALTPPCADASKCPTTFEFKNVATGATRGDPTNARTRVDLNSPKLTASFCRPLRVPRDDESIEDGTYPGWGSVTLDGGYGIEAGGGGAFLQHCGSRTRTLLTRTPSNGCGARACAPPHNRGLIIWQAAAGRLSGVLLHGLRRFQVAVPAEVDPYARELRYARADPYRLAVAGQRLFLQTAGGTVWVARLPAAP